MSSNVEERVVEMRFDNAKFDKNAQDTIKTLNALEKSLDLKGASKGFEDLEKAAKSVDLSYLEKSMDAVTNRFSVMGIIGDQVIRNLTTRLINMGEQWVKALPNYYIQQARAGWSKYEAKTNAVQVIMHSTHMGIEDVNKSLEDLAWYTDETSYKFDQMVDTISKFTGAGLTLEEAEMAAEGIANWAATAGVNANDASRAFYNLAQAMGTGALKNVDWKSIEMLNMGTNEFKETAIDVAKAMIADGRASAEMEAAFKKANPTIDNFKDSLYTGWMDKDVMKEVFMTYADRSTDFGMAAFKAAQEAKTFTDAVDAAKESVQTGWSNIFEQLFGNYEEARVFWTEVANEMIEVFTAPVSALSDLLTEWHDNGGYVAFIESIRNAWAAVKGIGEEVAEVFREIFPGIGADKLIEATKKLDGLTKSWRQFASKIDIEELRMPAKDLKALEDAGEDLTWYYENLEKAEAHNKQVDENLQNLTDTLRGLFSILNLGKTLLTSAIKILLPFTRLFAPIGKLLGTVTAALGRFSSAIVDTIVGSQLFQDIISGIEKFTDKLATGIEWLTTQVTEFLDSFLRLPIVESFVGLILEAYDAIKTFAGPYFEKISKGITTLINSAKNFIGSNFEGILSDVGNALMAFGGAVVEVAKEVKSFLMPAFTVVQEQATKLWNKLKELGSKIADYWTNTVIPSGIFNTLKTNIAILAKMVKNLATSLRDYIKNSGLGGIIQWLNDKLSDLWFVIRHFKFTTLLSEAFSVAKLGGILAFMLSIYKLSRTTTRFFNAIAAFPAAIKAFSRGIAIKRIATSLLMLAGALYILAKIDSDRIWQVAAVLGVLAAGLVAFTLAMSTVTGLLSKKGLFDGRATTKSILAMVGMAASLLILAIALKKISDIKSEDLWQSVLALLAIMGVFAVAVSVMSVTGTSIAKLGIGLLGIAAAILLLIFAFEKIQKLIGDLAIKKDDLYAAVFITLGLSAALFAMGMALRKTEKEIWQVAAIIASIGIAIFLVALAIERLTKFGKDDLIKGALAMLGLMAAIALIGYAAKKLPKDGAKKILSVATTILALSVAVIVLSYAIKTLAGISSADAARGLGRLLAIMLMLVPVLLAAGTIRASGGAMFGLATVIIALVAALTVLAKQDFGEMLKAAFILESVIFTVGIAMGIAGKAFAGSGAGVFGFAAIIVAISAALYFLAKQDTASLAAASIALGDAMITMAIAMRSAGKYMREVSIKGIVALATTIGVIGLVLYELAKMPVKNVLAATLALGVILGVLAGTMKIFANAARNVTVADSVGLVALLLAVVLPVIAALGFMTAAVAISGISVAGLLAITGALAILIPEMAGVAKLLSTVKQMPSAKDSGRMLLLLLATLTPVCLALGIMSAVIKDPSGLVQIATAIAEVVAALAIPIAATAAIGMLGGGKMAMQGVEGLAMFVFGITGVFAGLALLLEGLNALGGYSYFVSGLNKAKEIFGLIGEIGGALVGGLVAGFGDIISDSLPDWGTNIGKFLDNFAPALERLSAIKFDSGAADMLKSVAGAVLSLTAAEILDGLTRWFTGGTDFGKFATDISKMGPALKKFAENTKDIDTTSVSETATAIQSLADVAKTLDKDGGLFQKVVGHTKTLSRFANELGQMVETSGGEKGGLLKFAEAAPQIAKYKNNITDVAMAIGDMADLGNKMQTFGGLKELITGKAKTLGEFAAELAESKDDFIKFAEASPKIAAQEQNIRATAGAIGALVEVANAIQPSETYGVFGNLREQTQNLRDFMAMFVDVTEEVGGSYDIWSGKYVGSATKVKEKGVGSLLTEFIASISDIGEADLEKVGNVGKVLQALVDAASPLQRNKEVLKIFGSEVWTSETTSGLENLFAGIDAAMPFLKSAMGQMDDGSLGKLHSFSAVLTPMVSSEKTLRELGANAGGSLAEFALKLYNASKDFYSAGINLGLVPTENFSDFFDWLASFTGTIDLGVLSAFGDAIQSIGESLGTAFKDGLVKTTEANAQNIAKDMVTPIITKLDGFKSSMYNVGANFIQGLRNGIIDNLSIAESAGRRAGLAVVKGAKDGTQEKSPSKAARRIGNYFGEGLVIGLQDWYGRTENSASELGALTITAASSALDYIQQLLDNDMAVDMSIRPVLDLSDVRMGMTTLDSMFSQRQALAAEIEADSLGRNDEVEALLDVGWRILGEIQNGRDIYLDGKVLAGSMNRRLGRMEGL